MNRIQSLFRNSASHLAKVITYPRIVDTDDVINITFQLLFAYVILVSGFAREPSNSKV